MKKIIFLVTLLVFFTGCSIKSMSSYDINEIIDDALKNEEVTTNVVFDGYKYYLPRGIKIVDKKEYNSKLLSNGNYYYLYVDIISYYHKTPLEYTVDNNLYLSKKISYNGKEGYIEIKKNEEDNYFLKIEYNYSKIESYVSEDNLNDAVYDSIRILASVNYNDTIINSLIGDNILDYQEETFTLFESKREEGTFLDYIEEYDVYDDSNSVKDEDILDAES